MVFHFKNILLSFGLLLFSKALVSQATDSIEAKANTCKVIPLVYFTTETRGVVELFSYATFKLDKQSSYSNIRFIANYTQEQQYSVVLPFQLLMDKNKYFVTGKVELIHFLEYFYGIGNNTSENVRSKYTFNTFIAQVKALRLIANKTFVGFNLSKQQLETFYDETHEVFKESATIPGINGYNYCSVGPTFLYDSRDDLLTAKKGTYLEASYQWAKGIMSNEMPMNFTHFSLDFRKFVGYKNYGVLAFQGLADFTYNYVPYRAMPSLGGPKLLRGYYYGRFRDKQLILSNVEYRSPLYKRVGMAAFIGTGKVGNSLNNLMENQMHWAYGAGLRYQISKTDRATVRADFAKGSDSYGIYLFFAEAF
jgi:outer membrane protein assembly factor BamA